MSAFQDLIDAKGRPISQRDLYLSMGVNTAAGSLGAVWLAMTYGMPLTMYMQAIGASGVAIGTVSTVRLLAMAAQIPGALASEGLASRKPFWCGCALVHRMIWFALAAMALWGSPSSSWLPLAILAAVCASEALGNAAVAPWYSWMAELIPLPITGRFWGVRQSVITAAYLAGLVLAGQILDAARHPGSGYAPGRGFAIVFGIAASIGVTDIIVHLFVREPRPDQSAYDGAILRRILAPFASRNFRFLTLSLAAWNFGLAMITGFGLVYLKRDFGSTYSQLAALTVASALGAIVTSFAFGELIDRIGARNLGVLLYLSTPLPLAPWLFINYSTVHIGPFAFPQSIALLCASGIVTGAIYAAVTLCQIRLASELSAPKGRTMFIAVHWSFVGLLSALGPIVGGLVMDRFPKHSGLTILSGLPLSFLHAQLFLFVLLVWLVALPLLLAIRIPAPGAKNKPLKAEPVPG
jgi:MFS family permease